MDECPFCKVNFTTDEGNQMQLGIEIRGVYEGVLYWACKKCGSAWPKYYGSTRLAELSKQYADSHNVKLKVVKSIPKEDVDSFNLVVSGNS